MPRFKEHLAINVTALTLMEIQAQKAESDPSQEFEIDICRLFKNVGVGALGGAMPDLLEPSKGNPNHRGFCHSLACAVGLWWVANCHHVDSMPKALKDALSAFSTGYCLHLLSDLFLSKGKGMGLVGRAF